MGRIIFVAWLFVMALACIVIAIGSSSFGWLAGGVVLGSVAIYASRLLKREWQAPKPGPAGPRLSFLAAAILVMVLAILALYWLDTR